MPNITPNLLITSFEITAKLDNCGSPPCGAPPCAPPPCFPCGGYAIDAVSLAIPSAAEQLGAIQAVSTRVKLKL